MAERLALDFPLVGDPDLEIIDAYGLRQAGKDVSLPAVYVLDGDRKVVWRQVSGGIVERANLDDVLGAVPQPR